MKVHLLERRIELQGSIERCWEFFSSPRNLSAITPAALDFRIKSRLPERVYEGMMVEYTVRPLFGIPVTWLTEITYVREPHYFCDEQRVGPYHLWHHEHFFTQLDNGRVAVEDKIHYVLPFSPLTEWVHPWLVQPQLEGIFAYRSLRMRELFGADQTPSP